MSAPSRRLFLLKHLCKHAFSRHSQKILLRSFCCSRYTLQKASNSDQDGKDRYIIFRDERVQELLKSITVSDYLNKTTRKSQELENPSYLLLSDEELDELHVKRTSEVRKKLHAFVPFMEARTPIDVTLEENPQLEAFDSSKLAFIDISTGFTRRDRFITIRDTNGDLRKADWEERDRLEYIINPLKGRLVSPPIIFEEKQLEEVLKDGKVIYVLDRAVVQYEPDDPGFLRVTHRAYEFINSERIFDVVRATRHFGTFIFYLAWYKKIENLLIDMLQLNLIEDGENLVRLYSLLHPTSSIAEIVLSSSTKQQLPLDIIKEYCSREAHQSSKGELEATIQAYEESLRSQPQTVQK